MMIDESRELASARRLLSEFEADMLSPDAMARLTDALASLSDIVDAEAAESEVARNIAVVYAAKTAAAVAEMLAKPGEASASELHQWEELLKEFGRCGFESAPAAKALSKVGKRIATRYVGKLTQGEKELLLKKLEDDMGKA